MTFGVGLGFGLGFGTKTGTHVPFHVQLTESQLRKLHYGMMHSEGTVLRLTKEAVASAGATDGYRLVLTRRQITQLGRAKSKGTGCNLTLSAVQIKRMES